jgi:hypothetical protein
MNLSGKNTIPFSDMMLILIPKISTPEGPTVVEKMTNFFSRTVYASFRLNYYCLRFYGHLQVATANLYQLLINK